MNNNDSMRFRTADSIDAEYRFGQPKVYLAAHELARLTILRSRLGDTRAERIARAASGHATTALRSANRLPI